ncbi:hypothetical protein [Planktothrix sp. FACHB-1365]|uniref:hypothetical protein n=1 Tax=Planktothrix sp. FACHB-1365 TaxID=2692855 RepID=UPI00168281FF|nr:hypothetical protein [Planktothrix sp. FACHB-1365]MBD2482236.1 hypothetical protein [Planktothrix sp. FACHB-1365]
MKSKLLGGLCALIAVGSQLPAVAQNPIGVPVVPSDFDYKYQPKDPDTGRVEPPIYETLPDLALPDRTLPAAFKYPIIYELGVDKSITSDAVITDTVFIPNLPPIPNGITLDDVPRIRAEYTRKVEEWGEAIQGCLGLSPLLIKTDTGNPVLIQQQPAGTIVLNANNIAVCPK